MAKSEQIPNNSLLCCPFCKGSKEGDIIPILQNGRGVVKYITERGVAPYYVQCPFCLAQGPPVDNPLDAMDWWNEYGNINNSSSVEVFADLLIRKGVIDRDAWYQAEDWDGCITLEGVTNAFNEIYKSPPPN